MNYLHPNLHRVFITTHPAPHPVCKHTCIHEVLGSTFEYGLLMAAVRGPNAANQAWSRADGGHPGRGEDWAGVNSVLSQTGEGVGGRKERGKRKGKGRKEKEKRKGKEGRKGRKDEREKGKEKERRKEFSSGQACPN